MIFSSKVWKVPYWNLGEMGFSLISETYFPCDYLILFIFVYSWKEARRKWFLMFLRQRERGHTYTFQFLYIQVVPYFEPSTETKLYCALRSRILTLQHRLKLLNINLFLSLFPFHLFKNIYHKSDMFQIVFLMSLLSWILHSSRW